MKSAMKIFRNVCPRNCYGTCSMLSYVENGVLVKVTGDPEHGYSKGHLCAKGYAYSQYVYNPYRLKYPVLQSPRGSGNWKRISWEEAYNIISGKILELYDRYGSNLALGYNKFSGNLGILHYATEGMFNSLGPHTKPSGNLCMGTGEQAIRDSFGGEFNQPAPEDMSSARLIVIWGANPAVTNVHQMKFVYSALKKGGKLVVIDPLFTTTAAKADLYIQIHPGTDALLAHGIAKLLLEKKDIKKEPVHLPGWREYKEFLKKEIELETVCKETGVTYEYIEKLAALYKKSRPVATWAGFGVQRNKNGADSIRAMISLAALTGNIHIKGGGVYFAHDDIQDFPLHLARLPEKKHPVISRSRQINISNFAEEALSLTDPPLKFLWIASCNPLSQDQNFKAWQELMKNLELIVTVDLYMTETAKHSDLILPAASHFEEEDLHVGYWHHWLALNEKALAPYFEAKSDLQIARELTSKLNELSPGFSDFPYEREPMDWIKMELTPEIMERYGICSHHDLLDGPRQRTDLTSIPWGDEKKFPFFSAKTPTGQQSEKNYPYRLLSPQALLKIHSQYSHVPWLCPENEEPVAEISTKLAVKKEIKDGMKIKIYNEHGTVTAIAKTNEFLPKDIIVMEQSGKNPVNQLIKSNCALNNPDSILFYDCYVNISKKEGAET